LYLLWFKVYKRGSCDQWPGKGWFGKDSDQGLRIFYFLKKTWSQKEDFIDSKMNSKLLIEIIAMKAG
jgi:hypothetical protein